MPDPPMGKPCPACEAHRHADDMLIHARRLTKMVELLDARGDRLPDAIRNQWTTTLAVAARTVRSHARNHRSIAKSLGATQKP